MAHSPEFEMYARNLKRILWAEFIDEQTIATRTKQFRASIVDHPFDNDRPDLARHFDYYRARGSSD